MRRKEGRNRSKKKKKKKKVLSPLASIETIERNKFIQSFPLKRQLIQGQLVPNALKMCVIS